MTKQATPPKKRTKRQASKHRQSEAIPPPREYPLSLRLQVLGNRLTDAEQRVGAYFLEHPQAVYLSITEVVENSSLGYGSIIRFCRKMGCAGFQEFKVLLAKELAVSEAGTHGGEPGNVGAHVEKICAELVNTSKLIDEEVLTRAAAALNAAPRVLVAGIAGSEPPAVGFNYRLSRLGVHSQAVCEGYNLAIRAVTLQPGDVLLAISFSGATKDILAAAQIARKKNATVISLTNFLKAPLVELADLNLFSATDRDPMSCEIFSNISMNFVLDVLFTVLFQIRRDAKDMVAETFQAVSGRRV